MIAPGDELQVTLSMKQAREARTGIYTNAAYEVTKIFKHVPGMQQDAFPPSVQ